MIFSAQDIALVITTLTTAIAALSGVVLPVFREKIERKLQRHRLVNTDFKNHIDIALSEAHNRMETISENSFRKAQLDKGIMPETPEHKDNLELSLLRLEALGHAHDVPTDRLCHLVLLYSSTHLEARFSAFKGDISQTKILMLEAHQKSLKLRQDIMVQIARVFAEVRSKYPT